MSIDQKIIFLFRSSGQLNGTERVLLNWCRYIDYEKVSIAVCAHSGPMWEDYKRKLPHIKLYDFWFDNGCWGVKKFVQAHKFFKNLSTTKVIWLLNGMGGFQLSEILAGWVASKGNMYISHHNFSKPYIKVKPRLWLGIIPGLGFWRIKEFIKWQFIHFMCKRILVISNSVMEHLVNYWRLPAYKMRIGARGVDAQVFCPNPDMGSWLRKDVGLAHTTKIFIAINRFSVQKRVDRLLGAFTLLIKSNSDAYLLIAGNGELKERVEYKVSRNKRLKEHVKFLGYQNNILPFLQGSDFLLLSSDFEGEGNVIKEAMACGVIPISTDSYGPRGIKGTVFFSRRNVFSFFRAIEKALSLAEKDLTHIKEENLRITRDEYDIKKCAMNEVRTFNIPVRI